MKSFCHDKKGLVIDTFCHYIKSMKIEFDPEKDGINQLKHGVSLDLALWMDIENAVVIPDTRYNYGEPRFWAFAPIEHRLFLMAYTVRGDIIRVISLRKANVKEVKRYGH
jgi:uncharacterized DUF497 family protein